MDTVHETNDFVILQQTVKEEKEGGKARERERLHGQLGVTATEREREREREATRAARGDGYRERERERERERLHGQLGVTAADVLGPNLLGLVWGRLLCLSVSHKLNPDEQAHPSHVSYARVLVLQLPELLQQEDTELARILLQTLLLQHSQHRISYGHRDRVASKLYVC